MRASSRFFAVLAAVLALVATTITTPAHADVNVYTTPGEHTVNGRQWRTWCEKYSTTVRCHTEIMATTVLSSNGQYYRADWWTFNNLTYLSSPEVLWAGNPLATPGEHVINGRRWSTECKTPATGYGCRAHIWADVVRAVPRSSGGYDYVKTSQWVFNNIIQFGTLRTDIDALVTWRPAPGTAPGAPTQPSPPKSTPPTGAWDEKRGPNWTSKVTLTYDDCPTSLSAFRAVVVAAKEMNIGLALLPTGTCLSSSKFDAAYARAHGHYVYNHSVNHPDLRTLSRQGVMNQLGAPGVVTNVGRPPYGAVNSTVRSAYAAKGMRIWLWNVDTNDWKNKSQAQVVGHVVSNARPGNSVLMHMQWNGFSASALRQMRDGLAAKGIGVCKNYPGTTPTAPAAMDC